ncbi:hypothetical protein BTUL_0068g00410 [Botrytis tulipae]|uniref:Uncharacterized protein n=1 Tax=Botrytis tulipae TaxID=87230 RepID=A0A4Z1ERW4_9HELO|nr:hypothetical protein BTUL_0068g00410 [Botrytis tulipae]
MEGRETAINAPILTQHHLQTPGARTNSENITQNQQVHASSEDPTPSLTTTKTKTITQMKKKTAPDRE